jgi:hypothetical protein
MSKSQLLASFHITATKRDYIWFMKFKYGRHNIARSNLSRLFRRALKNLSRLFSE